MNHDHITPAERTGRSGRRPAGSRLRDAWVRADLLRYAARLPGRLHDIGDRFVVAVSLLVLAILIWLSIDDLVAWMLGLPPVTL